MDSATTERDVLEKLHDPTLPPIFLPLQFLKDITCNFSIEQVLGSGGYGVVYKGVLRSGKVIAVKKLDDMHVVEDDQFLKEVSNLMEIKHQNIVQLVGYCAESRWEVIKLPNNDHVMAQIPTRLLCFEYLCNRSLDNHVSDESSGLDWNKRYEIIKGVCSGLHFLHGECHIVHLDLKPANILMDATMTPKIADFGLSRLLGAQKSRTIIKEIAGSRGYMAPEYMWKGVVSPKADIFSFGVIMIEIITGRKNYPLSTSQSIDEVSPQQFTENVLGTWRKMFKKEPKYTSPEIYTLQVKQCITIALKCVDHDSTKRPTAWDIFQMLNAVESTNWDAEHVKDSLVHETSTCPSVTGEVVDKLTSLVVYEAQSQAPCPIPVTSEEVSLAEPQSSEESRAAGQPESQGPSASEGAQFLFDPGATMMSGPAANASVHSQSANANKELEDTVTQISCGQEYELLSAQPHQLCFRMKAKYFTSSCSLHLTNNTDHRVAFRILTKNPREYFIGLLRGLVLPRSMYTLRFGMSKQFDDKLFTLESTIAGDSDESPDSEDDYNRFFENAKDKGREVQQVKLSAVIVHEPGNMIIPKEYPNVIISIAVHPTEPWIFTGRRGFCYIWDYSTQETVNSFRVTDEKHLDYRIPLKFIARKKWLVVGEGNGYIKVYNDKTMQEVHIFKAHDSSIRALDIHPTEPYVLSASSGGSLIKLWNWEMGWECVRTFGFFSVTTVFKFNPKDTDYFAIASWKDVKIWSIDSSRYEFKKNLEVKTFSIDYFTRGDELYLIMGHEDGSATIWDWQSRACVETIECHKSSVHTVCAHPDLPILLTSSSDGTVRLWNSFTFELEGIVDCGLGKVQTIACLKRSRRIVIGHEEGLAVTEI